MNNSLITSKQTDFKLDNNYKLASLWKVFFARLFDLLICSIPLIIMSFFLKTKTGDIISLVIKYLVSFLWTFFYFVILSFLLKGNSLSKKLFKIELKSLKTNKISFFQILIRETWFIFIPLFIGFISTLIFAFLLPVSFTKTQSWRISLSLIIYQIGLVIVLFWFLGLMISIRLQTNHQSFIDIKLGLIVIGKQKIIKQEAIVSNQILTRNDKHISLNEQPGNFDLEFIDELKQELNNQNQDNKQNTNNKNK
ncbi:RDD family protein [Mycoplasma mycoides]|uniref:RDD family protein n=1 Tax=Mycoplasma mycoides TaxID=2102 RepID=UPI00223F9C1C|nr:RDD family protein [Mycoplasma mycoides]QVK02639.1 RDD family protein [Mycoplasma mycoides subsp. capri]QVK03454.1 RDD family protein [Mycoplasma mycoides subsp. capri]